MLTHGGSEALRKHFHAVRAQPKFARPSNSSRSRGGGRRNSFSIPSPGSVLLPHGAGYSPFQCAGRMDLVPAIWPAARVRRTEEVCVPFFAACRKTPPEHVDRLHRWQSYSAPEG